MPLSGNVRKVRASSTASERKFCRSDLCWISGLWPRPTTEWRLHSNQCSKAPRPARRPRWLLSRCEYRLARVYAFKGDSHLRIKNTKRRSAYEISVIQPAPRLATVLHE